MEIWVGFALAKEVRAVEWKDKEHTKPIAFIFRCPNCLHEQWARVDEFYTASDSTKNNVKCKFCHHCKPKYGDKHRRVVGNTGLFQPKATGWKSIDDKDPTSMGTTIMKLLLAIIL
jgi:hypothetical protein